MGLSFFFRKIQQFYLKQIAKPSQTIVFKSVSTYYSIYPCLCIKWEDVCKALGHITLTLWIKRHFIISFRVTAGRERGAIKNFTLSLRRERERKVQRTTKRGLSNRIFLEKHWYRVETEHGFQSHERPQSECRFCCSLLVRPHSRYFAWLSLGFFTCQSELIVRLL